MTTFGKCMWDTFHVLAVSGAISALGVVAASLFYIKDALELKHG